MRKKPLIETNPYLRDPEKYEESLIANVLSSTAIEIGPLPASLKRALKSNNHKARKLNSSQNQKSSS